MPDIPQERLDELQSIEAKHNAVIAGRLRTELVAGLTAAKVRPDALNDAAALLAAGAQAQFDDNGAITRVTVGDKQFATASEAAAEFVKNKGYFVASEAPPAKTPPTPPVENLNPAELISRAWATQ